MMRKAFTLIELLVVIAIIAILAAILFPVFAQAKAAAKHVSNLSNVKNLGLGVLIYTSDSDDSFPLAQRYEPSNQAFFGLEPWQVSTQPYIKSWGIFAHPLGPSIPQGDPALAAWRQTLLYGAPPKAANTGYTNFEATTAVGSFARRVCGGVNTKYDGLFGNGIGANSGETPWYGGTVGVASATTTSVSNPADGLMVTEGAMWDLWMGFGNSHPFTYGVYWTPGVYSATGQAKYSMAGPSARKNPQAQADIPGRASGSCTPANLCDGFDNFGIQNGTTTYVATDGHAVAKSFRGGLHRTAKLGDGTQVLTAFWPAGGY